jgi:hypothetical protein
MSLITRATIEAAVVTWLSDATSKTVILANQGTPRPARPYLTVLISSVRTVGGEDARAISAVGVQTIYGDREVSVSVQAFGAGALDLARAAALALNKETVRQKLATSGLCPSGITPIVAELTELLETDFEERAQFDAVLALGETYTDTVGLIEHVEGEGTITQPGKDDTVVPFAADKS